MISSLLPGRLDSYLLRRGLGALFMVASLIIVVALAIDFLINIGTLAKSTTKGGQLALIASLYWYRLPQLANIALPIGAVVSCLLVCAPMLKRGEFIALSANGISPARAARMLLALMLVVGVVDTVIADFISPKAIARTTAIEDILQNQRRLGRVWQVPATKTNWFAGRAQGLIRGDVPTVDRVVIASKGGLVCADQMVWQEGRWQLQGHLLEFRVTPEGHCLLYRPTEIPLEGDLALPYDPQQLYRNLLPRYTMTGPELLRIGGRTEISYAWSRWSRLVVPLLAALIALPVFVRFSHRDALVMGTIRALAAASVPVMVVVAGGMVADTSGAHPAVPVLSAVALALIPSIVVYWRWRL